MKLVISEPIGGERVSMMSIVGDETGLESVIPQSAQSAPDFLASILDSFSDSADDSSVDLSEEETEDQETADQQDSHDNAQLISTVRIGWVVVRTVADFLRGEGKGKCSSMGRIYLR